MRKHTFVCALVAVVSLSAAQERQSQPSQRNAQPKTQDANAQPVSTPIHNPSPQIDNAAEAERERERKKTDAEDVAFKSEQLRQGRIIVWATVAMAIFAGLNVVVAVIYAFYARKTLKAIKEQSGHASDQAIAAKTAAEMAQGQLVAMQSQERAQYQSLEAMRDQAKIMDRSLVLGTRAYVGVHSIVFDPHKQRIFLHIENIGKVPAKISNVTIELIIRVPDHLMPSDPFGNRKGWGLKEGLRPPVIGEPELLDYWELRIPTLHSYKGAKLFPGSLKIGIMIRLNEIFYITPEYYETITAGRAKMFVRGLIEYSDGFHRGKKTEFAFRYYLSDDIWIVIPDTGFERFQTDPEKPDSDYNPS